jgi:flagellar biosynthesis protein FlhG
MNWGDKKVIAVGGGKGGIGKSTFAANLGLSLSQTGKKVVVVDADLGAANLHTIMGVRYPEKTLRDFTGNPGADLEQILVETEYPDLRLLSSASEVLSIALPNYAERQRLFKALQKLKVDVIIFDIAAGTDQRATDFFSLASIGVIIVEPVPTSLENAYSFIKNLLVRALLRKFFHDSETTDFIQSTMNSRDAENALLFSNLLEKLQERQPEKVAEFREQFLSGNCLYVVANSVKSPVQNVVAENFSRIIKRYLALNMDVLGLLPYEETMDLAIIHRTPFVVKYPDSNYKKSMQAIVRKLAL